MEVLVPSPAAPSLAFISEIAALLEEARGIDVPFLSHTTSLLRVTTHQC